ncbi:hypothetical protein K2Z83_16775 [Oscillochloris sp. ZM17-4]|uniref:hypothetical protein n=1 Tax=Oscillochloris sp. ZM17-4 TaxID=2866714 RepID=UPI001C73929F|nr:hypothetical protein [Oscillochloris sp. ZM17-4]MBX0329327.1 hypothetical protein [Oscillochloris sp. ZM17-4]
MINLQAKLTDPQQFVTLYGSTPPRAGSSDEQIALAAERLAERVRGLPLDGLVVYDVQDESGRTEETRPFPYQPTIDPRIYARQIQERTGAQAITYKSVGELGEAGWLVWLREAHQDYGIGQLILVGSSVPVPPPGTLFVDRAMQLAREQMPTAMLGGVAIAERHSPAYDESRRLLLKAAQGSRFFISQVVYDPAPTLRLLADYAEACRREGVAPQRVILTFSPCGRPGTMTFLKWLGVAIAPGVEQAIMGSATPFATSIQICRANLRAIRERAAAQSIPLGVNIESVSTHRDELAASADLVQALYEELGVGG